MRGLLRGCLRSVVWTLGFQVVGHYVHLIGLVSFVSHG